VDGVEVALAVVLIAGLGYAAWTDWVRREVDDAVWQVLAVIGTVGGFLALLEAGGATALGLGLWVLAAGFVLQHLFPWDIALERWNDAAPGFVEIALYALVLGAVGGLSFTQGVGGTGVPVPVIAVVVSVCLARAMFEVGILYGGADAKALMVAGLLVPMWTVLPFVLPANAQAAVEFFPYALNLLLNAAILSIAVPIALALRNVRRGTFEFPRGFTSYPLPVSRLSSEFVWLRDPMSAGGTDEADTTEEDIALRRRQQADLEARGIREVWVTPQLPFVILLLAGAIVALLVGNLLFDVVSLV
jgi:Archaeal Peptidase A24 C-terminus Type II